MSDNNRRGGGAAPDEAVPDRDTPSSPGNQPAPDRVDQHAGSSEHKHLAEASKPTVEPAPARRATASTPAAQTERSGAEVEDRQARAAHLVELVARVARGDEAAFAALYDQTSSRIYGVILRVIRSVEMAQEITQEVYVEIWRQASRFTLGKGSVLAWMTTIAHRRAVDRVRSEAADSARDLRYAQRNTELPADFVWDSVEEHLDAERVRRGLSLLTDIQRQALALAYFGGHTHAEVATLLELPLGTAKTRIRDGLISLRDALTVEEVHP